MKKSFEEQIQELEKIINELENGNLNLDDSVVKFEEGMKISKECNKMLEDAEKKITILLNQDGDVKEENDYLSQEIPENSKIIDYESEKTISVDNIGVGDYVTLYVPTEESQNAQSIIIVAKKDYIINQIENQLLNKKEFHAELDYYNESENYIIVEIALENKTIENMPVQPMYYLDLRVGDNTETYLGWKEDNPNSNYGYHVHELCTIELETEITDLSNKYIVKSIEFIAD